MTKRIPYNPEIEKEAAGEPHVERECSGDCNRKYAYHGENWLTVTVQIKSGPDFGKIKKLSFCPDCRLRLHEWFEPIVSGPDGRGEA